MKRFAIILTASLLFALAGCGGDGGDSGATPASKTTISNGFSADSVQAQQAAGISSPYRLVQTIEPSLRQSLRDTLNTTSPEDFLGLTSTPVTLLSVSVSSQLAPVPARIVRPAVQPSVRQMAITDASPLQLIRSALRLPPGYQEYPLADGSVISSTDIRNNPVGSLWTLLEMGELDTFLSIFPVDPVLVDSLLDIILQMTGFSGSVKAELKSFLLNYYGIG